MANGKDNPSQSEVNKLLRVLSAERLKYTITLYRPGLQTIEFQCDQLAKLAWSDHHRGWILEARAGKDYNSDYPVIVIGSDLSGVVVTIQENPGHEKAE